MSPTMRRRMCFIAGDRRSLRTLMSKRIADSLSFRDDDVLGSIGVSKEMLLGAVSHTYDILDSIDDKLVDSESPRLAETVELANLSSIVGNLLGAGIAKHSGGLYRRNGPHRYPDLLSQDETVKNLEIKVSLEKNQPKGHLAKEGAYVTCRYVLCDSSGIYRRSKDERGDVVYIWELRAGWLTEEHFNISNTPGDSGKTAVINRKGMDELHIVYCDQRRCPYPATGRNVSQYYSLF